MYHNQNSILYAGDTLWVVINLTGKSDPVAGTFGLHLIGAYLNALTFPPNLGTPGYAFTAQEIINAYHALDGKNPAEFQAFAATLEYANNQFDALTAKP